MTNPRPHLLLIFCALLASGLRAQRPAPTPTPDPLAGFPTPEDLANASFTFRCAGWTRVRETLYYRLVTTTDPEAQTLTPPVFIPLDIFEMVHSRTFPQPAGQEVVFYRQLPAPPPDPAQPGVEPMPRYERVARATAPAGVGRLTLLFFPAAEDGSESYRIYPIPDDRAASPFGSYQFHNLSSGTIQAHLGGQSFQAIPGKPVTLSFEDPVDPKMLFAAWVDIDGRRKWLQRNTFTFNPNKHLKYFFYPEKERNGQARIAAKGLVEFNSPPPTDSE